MHVCLLAHKSGRHGEREAVPLTQRAVIVSVHRASCQREGEGKVWLGEGPTGAEP